MPTRRFRRHSRAASLTSYGLIVGLIAILAISAVTDIGTEITGLFDKTATTMSGALGSSSGTSQPSEESPDSFAFADTIDIVAGATASSDPVLISGLTGSVSVSVNGAGSPEYQICSDDQCTSGSGFTSAAGSISAGEYLQLRNTAATGLCAERVTTANVGGSSADWGLHTQCMEVVGTVSGTELNGAFDVLVSGSFAYVIASDATAVTAVDISTPTSPSIRGSFTTTGMGVPRGIGLKGDLAFVAADNGDSVTIVDFQDVDNPALEGQIIDNVDLSGAFAVQPDPIRDFAYVATRLTDTFVVIDIADTSNPQIEAVLTDSLLNGGLEAVLDGNYVYVGGNTNSFVIVDVTTPASPSIIGSLTQPSGPIDNARGLVANGNTVFAASQNLRGIVSLDVTNKTAPIDLDFIEDDILYDRPRAIDISGNFAFITLSNTDSLAAFDISDPGNLASRGVLTDATNLNNAFGIDTQGGYAYVANFTGDSLTVVDVP